MKKILILYLPGILILFLWFIFASPFFFQGRVPFPSTYQVNFFPPWSSLSQFWGPVKNNAMPDVISQIYPWRHFVIESYKNGQLPLWNPYNFSGNPHIANFQSAAFSPLNILFFILPFIDAWSLIVLLQPLIAGLGMYLLVKEYGISKTGSLISAISFMFCGFIVVWMPYGTLSLAISFLPIILFGLEKGFKKNHLLSFLIVSLSIPFSFFSGHFQTSLYVILFSFAYYIFKVVDIKKRNLALVFFFAIIFGLLIASLQIAPSIEFYLQTVRSGIFIKEGGIPFYYLITTIAPDFFGNPTTRNDWFGQYAEWSSFVGVIPLSLALIGIQKRKKQTIFLAIAAVIILIFAVDSYFQVILGGLKVPVLSTSTPSRVIVLFSFCITVLAGFGFDTLHERVLARKRKKIYFILGSLFFLLCLVWASITIFHTLAPDKAEIAKRNLIIPTVLFTSLCAITMLSITRKFPQKVVSILLFFLAIFVAFDSFRFVNKWIPFDPKNLVYREVPVITAIEKYSNNDRIYGNIGTEVVHYFGFQSIEGYDPLYIGRYGEFLRSASEGEFVAAERSVAKLTRNGKYTDRVLDLLGVGLIFHPIADTNQGWAYPVWLDQSRYTKVYQDGLFELYKNNQALPRTALFYDYQVMNDDKKIISTFFNKDFDFRKKIILEKDPNITKSAGTGSAELRTYTSNYLKIHVKTNQDSLLFVPDNYYPGWIAKVDGEDEEILRANYTFRAIPVKKGTHEIEIIYDPLPFKIGSLMAVVGIIGIIATVIFLGKKAKKKNT